MILTLALMCFGVFYWGMLITTNLLGMLLSLEGAILGVLFCITITWVKGISMWNILTVVVFAVIEAAMGLALLVMSSRIQCPNVVQSLAVVKA